MRGEEAFGLEGGADGGTAGVGAVVPVGEAGDEGGFAGVGGAQEDHFDFGRGDFDVRHYALVVCCVRMRNVLSEME